jgi:hypothetical protein
LKKLSAVSAKNVQYTVEWCSECNCIHLDKLLADDDEADQHDDNQTSHDIHQSKE